MINRYINFVVVLLLLQIATNVIAGLFILRHFPPIHVISSVIAGLIAILLLFIKRKWTPVLGVIYGLLFTILTVPSTVISMFRNIDPEYNAMLEASNPIIGITFVTGIIAIAIFIFSLLALKANIKEKYEPFASFSLIKGAIYGATILGLLISLYLQQHWVTGINEKTIDSLPTIVMKPSSVEPVTMELTSNETIVLHIQNKSENSCHILSFPELEASVHIEQGRSGLLFLDARPGTYTYECKPHHGYYHEGIKGKLTILGDCPPPC